MWGQPDRAGDKIRSLLFPAVPQEDRLSGCPERRTLTPRRPPGGATVTGVTVEMGPSATRTQPPQRRPDNGRGRARHPEGPPNIGQLSNKK